MSFIELKSAKFSYTDQIIFENINLEINKGEILCVIGPNGCGKTTLLDCILGVKRLSSGEIWLDGREITKLKTQDIAKHMAYVPQNHEKTFPYTVLEIVLMGRAAHINMMAAPKKEDLEIAEECLKIVGLEELRHRPYTKLSGGEGQLVMIARALAQKAEVIVLDEPTSHLDFKHEMIVLETIVSLVKDTKLSIVMATHFPNHAYYFENNNLKTYTALMSDKVFSHVGFPSEVLNEENIKHLYNMEAKIVSYKMQDNSELKQIIPIGTKFKKED